MEKLLLAELRKKAELVDSKNIKNRWHWAKLDFCLADRLNVKLSLYENIVYDAQKWSLLNVMI